MNVSARNAFRGEVSAIVEGVVNAEIDIALPGGDKLVAIVTEGSVKELGLAVGQPVVAYVKAPWVMLLSGAADTRFSARNQLAGKVGELHKGAVNTEVGIVLPGGSVVYAVITNEAVLELGLKPGSAATALIKASHVVLGVPA